MISLDVSERIRISGKPNHLDVGSGQICRRCVGNTGDDALGPAPWGGGRWRVPKTRNYGKAVTAWIRDSDPAPGGAVGDGFVSGGASVV